MTANFVLLETVTVGESGASSISFNNIPQSGYTDLKIVQSCRTTGTNGTVSINFNGITTGYTVKRLNGNGSSASSDSYSAAYFSEAAPSSVTASTFSNAETYIPNYLSSNAKSISTDFVMENNGTAARATLIAGLWSYTGNPAITSINIFPTADPAFAQYSTFSLYGLAAVGTTPVIAPYASGGDIIQTDGTYWYHAFLSSGTFTPAKGLSCQYLVIAGGGGGGGGTYQGAGGGAGGYRSSVVGESSGGGSSAESALSLAANTGYTVIIGAGGNGGVGFNPGVQGSNSTFATITSTGGGYGGTAASGYTNGGNGGSGGGGSNSTSGSGGTPVTGQGYAGSTINGTNGSGAGGGAGAIGGAATNSVGGAGGIGVASSITGTSVYRAGGGGGSGYGAAAGGAGGNGGGGAGGSGTDGSNATPNTGGGGGGAERGGSAAGGKGGSGIVIVRYAI